MAKKTDQKTLDLIAEVTARKAEISKLEKPNWQTNCCFTFVEGRMNDSVNIHVETDIRKLVDYAAFIRDKERSYNETAAAMSVEAPAFTWCGFSAADWLADIKTRIDKVQIASKKKKLEELEKRLNAVISPELRAQMELDAIAAELG